MAKPFPARRRPAFASASAALAAAAALSSLLLLSSPSTVLCSDDDRDRTRNHEHHDHSSSGGGCADPADPHCTSYKLKRSLPTDLVEDDGYEWPTLFEEADDMLDASLLMYPMATLRTMAKREKEGDLTMTGGKHLVDVDVILKEPATAREIEGVLTANLESIQRALGDEEAEIVDDALETIIARHGLPNTGGKRAVLVEFDDDNSQSELVYAIGVDHALKRVTLGFRGSVTKRDFLQDAQIWMQDVPNPFRGAEKTEGGKLGGQPAKIGIHNGFHDYLFYNATEGEKEKAADTEKKAAADAVTKTTKASSASAAAGAGPEEEEEDRSKYEIIEDQVLAVLSQNPGYKLYVTGHSLGGALSTLFAFMASAREEMPKPVTCVSIASPYVGDRRWKKAFQFAESKGLLRHLRVSNQKDIVTLMPFLSLRLRGYKHVGHNLKLYGKRGLCRLVYPKVGKRFTAQAWSRIWSNSLLSNPSLKYLINHGTSEYNRRLDAVKGELDNLFLNDLYANRTVVGLLDRFVDRLTGTPGTAAPSEN